MEKHLIILLLAVVATVFNAQAQSESGMIMGLEVEKKVNKQFGVGLEADYRTRNDFKTIDRWSVGLNADYKLTKWLKADAGYSFLRTNFREKITTGSSKTKWRPSYWGNRHRFHLSLGANYKVWSNLRISLRERWQYTYRPEKSVERWKIDETLKTKTPDDDYVRDSKGNHQLRSRLQVEWDQKRALLTPFANMELYNSMAIEKIRYTVGTDISLAKQHSLSLYYRFQDVRHQDEDEYDPDMHYFGVGYKFKF
jgi:hypothetical protein